MMKDIAAQRSYAQVRKRRSIYYLTADKGTSPGTHCLCFLAERSMRPIRREADMSLFEIMQSAGGTNRGLWKSIRR